MEDVQPKTSTWFNRYHHTPLYLRILFALLAGILIGLSLGWLQTRLVDVGQSIFGTADWLERLLSFIAEVAGQGLVVLSLVSKIVLQLLGALAPPLILIAVVHVLMNTEIPGRSAGRLVFLLLLNTVVAILIGLTVTNVLQPGNWFASETKNATAELSATVEEAGAGTGQKKGSVSPVDLIVRNIPRSLLGPLGDQANIIGVIFIAIAFGVAFRKLKHRAISNPCDLVQFAYDALIVVLHWIIDLVPLGVLCIVAHIVGTEGFMPFATLGGFVLTVIVALVLQAGWYLLRIKYFSWCRPVHVLIGMRDALLMAFSTSSSTATMPVTYKCLRENVKLREKSASLGGLVGANFNNDGTALYEASAAIFIAQSIGTDLSLVQQILIVLTSIVASVGAAGIPEAGLVTMTLVFTAVGLPTEKIATLLAVDWFLDRCRTTVNVLGDVNVSCILDGMIPEQEELALETPRDAQDTLPPKQLESNR